jgi:hypothetical protein
MNTKEGIYHDLETNKFIPCIEVGLGELNKEQIEKLETIFKNTSYSVLYWLNAGDNSYNVAIRYLNDAGFKPDYINGLILNILARRL